MPTDPRCDNVFLILWLWLPKYSVVMLFFINLLNLGLFIFFIIIQQSNKTNSNLFFFSTKMVFSFDFSPFLVMAPTKTSGLNVFVSAHGSTFIISAYPAVYCQLSATECTVPVHRTRAGDCTTLEISTVH